MRLPSGLLQFLLLDFEFLVFGGDAGVTNMHRDTKSGCKCRRGTLAFRAYVMQQQKASDYAGYERFRPSHVLPAIFRGSLLN